MARGKWITGDSIPAAIICRVLQIPDEPIFRAAVTGALSELIYADNFQQIGAVTPGEMAAAMLAMYNAFLESECGTVTEIDLFYHEEAQGVGGGGVTANVKFAFPYNVTDAGNFGNVIVSNGIFTVQPGKYIIHLNHVMRAGASVEQKSWWGPSSFSGYWRTGLTYLTPANVYAVMEVQAYFETAIAVTAAHIGRASVTTGTTALGNPTNDAGEIESYGFARFERVGDF